MNRKNSKKLVPLLSYFTKTTAEDVHEHIDALLTNVDFHIRERLSAKLHSDEGIRQRRIQLSRCSEQLASALTHIANGESCCNDMPDRDELVTAITLPVYFGYQGCLLSSQYDPSTYEDDDEEREWTADDLFSELKFPAVPIDKFFDFTDLYAGSDSDLGKDKEFLRLVRELPKMSDYGSALTMRASWSKDVEKLCDQLKKVFEIAAAFMKLCQKRAEGERMLLALRQMERLSLDSLYAESRGIGKCSGFDRVVVEHIADELIWALGEVDVSMRYDSLPEFDELAEEVCIGQ